MPADDLTDEEAITSAILLGGTFRQFNDLWFCYIPTPGASFAPNRRARAIAFRYKADAARKYLRKTLKTKKP